MSTINNQPTLNPHMKLAPRQVAIIQPPAVYSYSLTEEMKQEEKEYKKMLDSINKNRMMSFSEKHPNLKNNIIGVLKYTIAFASICLGYRYRHSIPILKSICKKPEKTPPKFREELQRVWDIITRR